MDSLLPARQYFLPVIKKLIALLFSTLICTIASAQFSIEADTTTGAIRRITNPSDKYHMNWIFASGDSNLTWQKREQDWGMGKYDALDLGIKNERWTVPANKSVAGKKSVLFYKTKCLDVRVEREPSGNDYIETYTFTNATGKALSVSNLDIYTPFNDNYPDAQLSGTNRCNAHVWAGMNSSYVNAIRMDGEGPHLGLVLTKGAISTYSVENRIRDEKHIPWKYSASNVRGTIVLNIAPFVLQAGGSYTVQWRLFWHQGWDDFYKKAVDAGFVKLDASHYVIQQHEHLTINIVANASAGIKNKSITIQGDSLGEHSEKVYYDGGKKQTTLTYLTVSSPQNVIDKRVHFIVQHQQMNDSADRRNGAYMVYDNEGDSIFTNINLSVAASDKDEGRERVGMGVLIAKWLQTHRDDSVRRSLMRYVAFVRNKLQNPDYQVFSDVARTSPHRGYNYPWVAHLYLETYKLTKDKKYLTDFVGTYLKYFKEIGYKHYSIDFRVTDALDALEQAGMKAERDSLFEAYKKVGDFFAKTGIDYPSSEVNYEQSIVAPAVTFLCEMYQITKDRKYLDGAKVQLRSLEAFNGRQPDVHLNEIAIRHWDGYWFGKREMWGDVMPHYWSTLTAVAFDRYYECTGEESYKKRAEKIVENNLLNFKEDGSASCAYIYPASVDGKPGKFYDEFANDQDWALVFYMQVNAK